jgi:hypothetical protein
VKARARTWELFATEYIFVKEGMVEQRLGWLGVYTYNELVRLLEAAGFGKVEGFASLTQEPFGLGSRVLYLTATRRLA